mgnify:CR=1 FL=1
MMFICLFKPSRTSLEIIITGFSRLCWITVTIYRIIFTFKPMCLCKRTNYRILCCWVIYVLGLSYNPTRYLFKFCNKTISSRILEVVLTKVLTPSSEHESSCHINVSLSHTLPSPPNLP